MMEDNEILKNYIREQRYSDCISFLEKKIVDFVIKEIRKHDNTIKFTTLSDLISVSDFYLQNSSIAYSLSLALNEENPLEQIRNLIEICEEYNIK